MIYNNERQVPYEYELNRFIRTEVTENLYLYFFLLLPFDNIFLMYFPLFYWRVKMQLVSKKTTLDFKNGECQVKLTFMYIGLPKNDIRKIKIKISRLDMIVLSRTQLTSPTPFHYISHIDRHNAERQTN